MGLGDFTLQAIGFRLLTLVIVAPVLGAALAAAAFLLGDRGPRYDGRLTLAPTAHVDVVGAFTLVLFGLGWTKAVDVDPRELRTGPGGIVLVLLAGAAALLILAALLNALVVPAVTSLPHTAALTTAAFLREASSLTIWIALLGLLPVPPLPGGVLLRAVGLRVPRQAEWALAALLVLAVATGVARRLLGPVHSVLAALLLGQ